MEKICVLIRVYDRLEDLTHCLDIINATWSSFEYYIILVSNGNTKGFIISDTDKKKAALTIELDSNAGHLKGNAQLLHEGLQYIPDDTSYTIILEADTWMYSDTLIKKYTQQLSKQNAVWASANWYAHLYSLATDFAIINTGFLKSNRLIFKYTGFPECYAATYLLQKSLKFIYITENMPVHLPSYIKKYPFASGIRFNVFPESKMVTHHIETLEGGMATKKMLLNTVAGQFFFKGDGLMPDSWLLKKIKFCIYLSFIIPAKGWILKKREIEYS